jgi:hypothetical protein
MDPHRAIMFMQEATAICTCGPPVEADVWQKLSWRSSSIQWQLANEGIAFVQQTMERVESVENSVLRYLLNEAASTHWCASVRERARELLLALPQVEPSAPKIVQIAAWRRIREIARERFPKVDFARKATVRR